MNLPELPAEVEELARRLQDAGLRVHLVGGALRDMLLGRKVRDYDLFVDGDLARVTGVLPEGRHIAAARPVVLVPASSDRPQVEISAARPGAETLEQDLRLRDFTLNAIAFEPATGEWLDPCHGRNDLDARRLRLTDARVALVDDPVRVLRGVRLAAELALQIDPGTASALARNSWRLHDAPGERLGEELLRLLGLADPAPALAGLQACGALAVLLPEALRGAGVAWPPGVSDLLAHGLALTTRLHPDPLLRLAALLHGAAAAESKRFLPRSARFVFPQAELRAASHVAMVASRLRLSRRDGARIERLIRHAHPRAQRLKSDVAIRRMLRRVGRDILDDVLELQRADLALRFAGSGSRRALLADWGEVETRVRAIAGREELEDLQGLAIGGKEIMHELSMPEGPDVQRWLMRMQRRVWAQPEDNTRERLLAWLREARGAEAN